MVRNTYIFNFFILVKLQIGSSNKIIGTRVRLNQAGLIVFDSLCGVTTEKCPPYCLNSRFL